MPFPLRDYQYEAFSWGVERKRATFVSPTGSGKSLIIYILMRWYLQKHDKKVLIIVPTTSLVEQLYKDFQDYGFRSDDHVHKIYSGKDKKTNKRIVITTWQSIHRLTPDWFADYGCIFGDECHGFKAKSLSSIMNKATQAEYRFGTTGTLDGTQTHKLVLEGLFGPVKKVTTTKKLQENDTLAALDIDVLLIQYPDQVRKDCVNKTYVQEMDFIVRHEGRNKFIRNLALTQQGNTLVLFQYVEKHGKQLQKLISEKRKDVYYVHGNTHTDDREAVRGIVENKTNAIIVASMGTFSTGINIKNIHNIIFASPSKSQIRVLQSIGRGLRKSTDGRSTKLYDLTDDLHWQGRKNYTLNHSFERIKIYESEEFNYKIHKVEL
jgi:superfamily II DNA or RNA helicase